MFKILRKSNRQCWCTALAINERQKSFLSQPDALLQQSQSRPPELSTQGTTVSTLALVPAKKPGSGGVKNARIGPAGQQRMGKTMNIYLSGHPDTLKILTKSDPGFYRKGWVFVIDDCLPYHIKDFEAKRVSVLLDFGGIEVILTE